MHLGVGVTVYMQEVEKALEIEGDMLDNLKYHAKEVPTSKCQHYQGPSSWKTPNFRTGGSVGFNLFPVSNSRSFGQGQWPRV